MNHSKQLTPNIERRVAVICILQLHIKMQPIFANSKANPIDVNPDVLVAVVGYEVIDHNATTLLLKESPSSLFAFHH